MPTLATRLLGRTGREVTTLGLGGQAALMLTPPGVDPVAIVEKAYRLGVTYFDTSNAYGTSQSNLGAAFRRVGLVPGAPEYGHQRAGIYLASKTHMRTCKHPQGQKWRNDYSDGADVSTAQDDVRRSLSLLFGDGTGDYPGGAYLDCIQIHNLTAEDDVDMIYAGLDDPTCTAPWLGALAGLLDLRDGTNWSGTNPKLEKLVRHIGITGHYSSPALMYAIRRDQKRILDTLLTALNPADINFFCHRYNSVPVAVAAGMGVIGMKVFADASFYGEPPTFNRTPADVYQQVGSPELSSQSLIQYALSIPGVTLCLTGIGHISDDSSHCQLAANLAAAQIAAPLTYTQQRELEALLVRLHVGDLNTYFQRTALGLTPPRNVGSESDIAGFAPSTPRPRPAVRVSWDTAYAGKFPILRYDVLRDGVLAGTVPHLPQISCQRFVFEDTFEGLPADNVEAPETSELHTSWQWTRQRNAAELAPHAERVGMHIYTVRAVDASGSRAESLPLQVRL